MIVEKDETMPVRSVRRCRAGAAGRAGAARSRQASAWSTRPRSSPPPARSRATRSITAAAATVRIEIVRDGVRRGVRLTFTDQGPGIADIDARDDRRLHQRRRASGLGLSGAKRLSNEFEIKSAPGQGNQWSRWRVGNEHDHRRRRCQPGRCSPPARQPLARAHRLRRDRDVAEVAIVATEMATNLLKHAGGGRDHRRRFDDADGSGSGVAGARQGRGHGRHRRAAWRTAIRRPAARAPGSAPSPARPTVRHLFAPGPRHRDHGADSRRRPPPRHRRSQLGVVVAPYPGETGLRRRLGIRRGRGGPDPAGGRRLGPRRRGGARRAQRGRRLPRTSPMRLRARSMDDASIARLTPTRGAAVAVARIDAAARTGPLCRGRQYQRRARHATARPSHGLA